MAAGKLRDSKDPGGWSRVRPHQGSGVGALQDGPSPESQNSDPEPVSPNAHILQMGKLSHKEQTGLGATEWGNPEVYLARFLGCFKRKKSPFSPQRQRTAGSTSPCGAASASASLSALAWWSVKWVHDLNWLKRSLIPGEGERWRSWEPSGSRRVTPAEERPLGAVTSSFPSPSLLPLCLCLSHFVFATLSLPTYLCVFLPVSACVFFRPYRLLVQGGGEDTPTGRPQLLGQEARPETEARKRAGAGLGRGAASRSGEGGRLSLGLGCGLGRRKGGECGLPGSDCAGRRPGGP